MPERPYFNLHTGDYLGDTLHLSTIEHGAYLLLLIACSQSIVGGLPKDDAYLARASRLGHRWPKYRDTITRLFFDNGERYYPQPHDLVVQSAELLRGPIPRWVRDQLWMDSKGRCSYCGEEMVRRTGERGPKAYTIDHIVPVAQGGSDDITNLAAACRTCNNEKGAARPSDV